MCHWILKCRTLPLPTLYSRRREAWFQLQLRTSSNAFEDRTALRDIRSSHALHPEALKPPEATEKTRQDSLPALKQERLRRPKMTASRSARRIEGSSDRSLGIVYSTFSRAGGESRAWVFRSVRRDLVTIDWGRCNGWVFGVLACFGAFKSG